jgi:hypothetical protein
LAEPNKPPKEKAGQELQVELARDDDMERLWVLKRTGAMKDRRPSPKWLAIRKRKQH